MADITTELFWEILKVIQGDSSDLVTDALEAIALSEKETSEQFFANVIDQSAYLSQDYARIRGFFVDMYAAHKTLTTFQAGISDPYEIPNDQLDDLFQSFGYPYSASLRDPISNEPLTDKVNFFLDLVNLYKIKGSPEAILNVLRYYGIKELDIFEFFLQFDDRQHHDPTDLQFKGDIVASTTNNQDDLYLPYDLLTLGDPHWLYKESQIRQLQQTNKINFPSKSPYYAIRPVFDEASVTGVQAIVERLVQDQYESWKATSTVPEQNAIATITGDTCSLLALYLSCLYIFNQEYIVGQHGSSFICYDGTSTDATIILNEYQTITGKPDDRADYREKLQEYYDTFSRVGPRHFLQNKDDAGLVLASLNPTLKANLDSLADNKLIILASLLRDLGEWIRANLHLGFSNMSFILVGLATLFDDLKGVIDFFKPYRARLVPLEMFQFNNRLLNTIILEDLPPGDDNPFDVFVNIVDYLSDCAPCCAEDGTNVTCIDATSNLTYSRETYDCGSYHDIGSITDIKKNLFIEYYDDIHDVLNCIPSGDATAIIDSEIIEGSASPLTSTMVYTQSGGFAQFDKEGTFDCTHGFDVVQIEVESVSSYLLQENGDKILQEDGFGILL